MPGACPGAASTRTHHVWPLAVALAPFILLCTLNSAGYRYGASDLAFYVPAALARFDPALFPRDAPLIASQARLTTVDEILGGLLQATDVPLPALLFVLYCLTLALLAAALWRVGSHVYRHTYSTLGLLAAMTLRHAISRTGTNTLEAYFHPRQLAFALGALALAGFLARARVMPALLLIGAGLLHPTTAVWFAVWLGVATAVEERHTTIVLGVAAASGIVASIWLLTTGALAGRLVVMDPEWLATLATKDYLFPLEWPVDVWLINLSYAPIILAIYWHRRAAGLLVSRETGIVVGCLSLVLVFALTLPFNAIRVALAVQLQVPRVFWMLDLLATVYVVWALAEGAAGTPRRARIAAAVIALATLARGSYVMFVKFPDRPVAQIGVGDNDWGRAMAWARGTPRNASFAADPMHAVKYGTSLRVAGERDVFVEAVKDAAIGMYERPVAIRTRDHLALLADYDSLTANRARALAAQHGLDYLVSEQLLDLPIAFQSGAIRVYSLK